MPITTSYNRDRQDGGPRYSVTISCRDCGVSHTLESDVYDTPPRDEIAEQAFRFHVGNQRYLARCRSCERAHVRQWRSERAVSASAVASMVLNGDRPFGVELELIFPYNTSRSVVDSALAEAGLTGWRAKSDGSLSARNGYGLEVVSPILRGDDGHRQVADACRVLSGLGARPNRSCGMHVHHDVADLSIADVKRLVLSWTNNQPVIDRLVSASRRGGSNSYCRRVTDREVEVVQNMRTLRDLRAAGYNLDRYRTLNLVSYGRYGTVEIRQHQGTVDATKVSEWVRFGQALVERSKTEEVTASTSVADFFAKLGNAATEATRRFLERREAQLAGAVA